MLLDEVWSPGDRGEGTPLEGSLEETRAVLGELARRALSDRLAGVFVEQAIRVGREGDFALKLGAMRALLARVPGASGSRVRRLDGKRGGRFRVRSSEGAAEDVWLEGVEPLEASCGCGDFGRNGLGLCVHTIAVLNEWDEKEQDGWQCGPAAQHAIRVDPLIPLKGKLDHLSRVRIEVSGVLGRQLRSRLTRARERGGAAERASVVAMLSGLDVTEVPASPAAETLLAIEAEHCARQSAAESTAPRAVAALSSLGRDLYSYQRESVERFLGRGALLIADDMGLGKTTQAIAACHALVKSGTVQRVLLVVPASLKPQWRREWQATTDVPLRVVDGQRAERADAYRSDEGVLVVGYEQLRLDLDLIRRFEPEMVVLDEAQRIKNPATKTAHAVLSLKPRYRLALSGTPLQNRLSELASVIAFIDPRALGPTWQLLAHHTFETGNGGAGESGARFLDELRQRMDEVMVRRRRKEVLSQLPARTDTRVPVALTEPQWMAHADLEEPIRILMAIRNQRPLTVRERDRLMLLLGEQRRICNGLAQRDFAKLWPTLSCEQPTEARLESLDAPKLAAFVELIRALAVDQRRKVVVFSEWRAMLRLAAWASSEVLRSAGLRAGFFTGKETPKMRERALVDFHDDPSMGVLFLTDAGGVGLNLQRAASACVQLELPWNPAVMEQRIARIHRLGQTQPIDVFHLVSEPGIESKIAGLLGRKQALSTALLDADEVEVRFATGAGIFDLATSLEVEPAEDEVIAGAEAEAPHAPTPGVPTPEVASPAVAPQMAPLPLAVTRRPDGGLSFDIPKELAAPMAQLLASMVQALTSVHS